MASEDSYHQQVILPNILRLVAGNAGGRESDGAKGFALLDLACGQGFFAEHFRKEGGRVIGVDAAPTLIERARQRSPNIDFRVGWADQLSFLPDQSFDVITLILALQNIKEVDGVFAEVARLLKKTGNREGDQKNAQKNPTGRFYIVLNHPCFRIPKMSTWGWDEESAKQYRRIDSYLSESSTSIVAHPSDPRSAKTISFHRPLQYYFKLLNKHGLSVTKLEEWISHKKSQKGKRTLAEDTARKEIPLFLCIEAR